MKIWIDLANSPHVPLFAAVATHLERIGHELVVTARDQAQTVALAKTAWPHVLIIGDASPPSVLRKGLSIAARARALRTFAAEQNFDVALSHGSYAQIVASRSLSLPSVTMMDYEHQPANHVSFRLASRVVVPRYFPIFALRRQGALPRKTSIYDGFKEDLYLSATHFDDPSVTSLQLRDRICVVLRPPPTGALYHRHGNDRFVAVVRAVLSNPDLCGVLLPRTEAQRDAWAHERLLIPGQPLHGPSLLARADVVVGAGGTMNREAALLGIPTYTVFAGRLAAVDAELIRRGLMRDLREGDFPRLERKARQADPAHSRARAPQILEILDRSLTRT